MLRNIEDADPFSTVSHTDVMNLDRDALRNDDDHDQVQLKSRQPAFTLKTLYTISQ